MRGPRRRGNILDVVAVQRKSNTRLALTPPFSICSNDSFTSSSPDYSRGHLNSGLKPW